MSEEKKYYSLVRERGKPSAAKRRQSWVNLTFLSNIRQHYPRGKQCGGKYRASLSRSACLAGARSAGRSTTRPLILILPK
jgi:hypothetical protein